MWTPAESDAGRTLSDESRPRRHVGLDISYIRFVKQLKRRCRVPALRLLSGTAIDSRSHHTGFYPVCFFTRRFSHVVASNASFKFHFYFLFFFIHTSVGQLVQRPGSAKIFNPQQNPSVEGIQREREKKRLKSLQDELDEWRHPTEDSTVCF